jgi:hypothetical protein
MAAAATALNASAAASLCPDASGSSVETDI